LVVGDDGNTKGELICKAKLTTMEQHFIKCLKLKKRWRMIYDKKLEGITGEQWLKGLARSKK